MNNSVRRSCASVENWIFLISNKITLGDSVNQRTLASSSKWQIKRYSHPLRISSNVHLKRVNGRDATQSDDGPSWRTRGRKASKGSELAKNNYSGYYTKEDMLSLYSPYFRPPNGFPSYDKVTSKTPLPPVALSAQPSEEDDEVCALCVFSLSQDDFSFSKGRGRGRGSRGGGRGGAVKSEYGWGKEEKGGRRSKPESPWKKGGDEEGFFGILLPV